MSSRIRTVAEIDGIASLGDPVIRNLRITQCYHEISAALAERLGSGANWCTFATWASRQAGQTIRREDMIRAIENLAHGDSKTREAIRRVVAIAGRMGSKLGAADAHARVLKELLPLSALERSSDAVARGNRKVFEEIAREFARFCATCLNDREHAPEKIEEFRNGLRPGDPPDGQDYLRRAFGRYYQAFFEIDPKSRAEIILLANIEIGYHEQTRLQPEIREALDAALVDSPQMRERLIKILFPPQGFFGKMFTSISKLFGGRAASRDSIVNEAINAAIDALIETARQEIRALLTEHMMTLALPGGRLLRLGADLSAEFPLFLRDPGNADLLAFLGRVDPTPHSLLDSAARDWGNLPDRLHFIVDMFRCYQESRDLFTPPFTEEQVAAFMAGKIPSGQL